MSLVGSSVKSSIAAAIEEASGGGGGGGGGATKIWYLSRWYSGVVYGSVDYAEGTHTAIASHTMTGGDGGTQGITSDGTYVIGPYDSRGIAVIKWTGSAFSQIAQASVSSNVFNGNMIHNMPAGYWGQASGGDYGAKLQTGPYTASTVSPLTQYNPPANARIPNGHITMDFKKSDSGIGTYDGYGNLMATTGIGAASTAGGSTWTFNSSGEPQWLDEHLTNLTTNANWVGFDRNTGYYTLNQSGTTIWLYKIDLTTGISAHQATITTTFNVYMATMKGDYLITVGNRTGSGDNRDVQTWTVDGSTLTFVDEYTGFRTFFTDTTPQGYIEADPFSDYLYALCRRKAEGGIFKVESDGTITPASVNFTPATLVPDLPACVNFMSAPLPEIP